jgi:hypothetical protein
MEKESVLATRLRVSGIDAGGEEEWGKNAERVTDVVRGRPQPEEEILAVAEAEHNVSVLDFGQNFAGVAKQVGEGLCREPHTNNIQQHV